MNILKKFKEYFIIEKTYNIGLLRCLMGFMLVVQILLSMIPILIQRTISVQIINLIYVTISLLFAFVVDYIVDILLFYIIFRKQLNKSFRIAEKQIAPLLFLQMLIPFIFNLVNFFVATKDFNNEIKIIQFVITIIYVGYLVFGNVFKEKCIIKMIIYFMINLLLEILLYFQRV